MAQSRATATPGAGSPGEAGPGWRARAVRREYALAVLLGWLLGAGSILGWAALTSGWYEYFVPASDSQMQAMVNEQGWEVVSDSGDLYLRRPRVSFHGVRGPLVIGGAAQLTSTAATASPTSKATANPRQESISLSGSPAVQQTDPFHLDGGTYRFEWTATARPDRTCFFRVRLFVVGEEGVGADVAVRVIPSSETGNGAAFVQSVSRGQHYLDLTPIAGERCRWTMTLTQQ